MHLFSIKRIKLICSSLKWNLARSLILFMYLRKKRKKRKKKAADFYNHKWSQALLKIFLKPLHSTPKVLWTKEINLYLAMQPLCAPWRSSFGNKYSHSWTLSLKPSCCSFTSPSCSDMTTCTYTPMQLQDED